MHPYIIGLDIGTGSIKAVAINSEAHIVATAQASYPSYHPQVGWHEQNPEEIWEGFVKCIREIIEKMDAQPAGVSLSSAMHSITPVDKAGTPLMNMITWADKRAAAIADHIRKSSSGEMLYEQTGTPIHAMSPLCKIIWLRENNPAVFAGAHKFISLKEYIWFKLFNQYQIDYSIASANGMFDIEKLKWNDNALALAGINTDQLSEPVSTGYMRKGITANAANATGLIAEVPFIIGSSDGCTANLGSFATQPGVAALTIGTSGAIRVGNTKPTFNFESMTFNYVLDENTFISGGPVNNGGVALKWYIECFLGRSFATADDYTTILKEIENVNPGADGLVFLPYLLGERAPLWNSDASAVFFGATIQHKQPHFTRAVIEGITYALYHVATELEAAGSTIDLIIVSGGFIHSNLWVQILCDIFNKKVCLMNADDASALGAAYIALKSLNFISDYRTIKRPEEKIFLPNPQNHEAYKKSFARYRRLYNLLKDEMTNTVH